MTKKAKAYISILSMAIIFFMNITTKYTRAFGDYVLEFFRIQSWSGNGTGGHLSVLYFGILFFLSIIFVRIYAIERYGMKKRKIFVIFVLLIVLFTQLSGTTAQYIKKNSEDLLSIAFTPDESFIEYSIKENELSEFEAYFSLENYSEQIQEFTVGIDSRWYREDGLDRINIVMSDGTKAMFILYPGESKEFKLALPEYRIIGEPINEVAYSRSSVTELILTNKEGQSIKLTRKDIFGEVLSD